jgi:hypothetical protein
VPGCREQRARRGRPGAPAERTGPRAELDAHVAHLYRVTEEEFAYILTTFLLVGDPMKVAAHNAYRDVAPGAVKWRLPRGPRFG